MNYKLLAGDVLEQLATLPLDVLDWVYRPPPPMEEKRKRARRRQP